MSFSLYTIVFAFSRWERSTSQRIFFSIWTSIFLHEEKTLKQNLDAVISGTTTLNCLTTLNSCEEIWTNLYLWQLWPIKLIKCYFRMDAVHTHHNHAGIYWPFDNNRESWNWKKPKWNQVFTSVFTSQLTIPLSRGHKSYLDWTCVSAILNTLDRQLFVSVSSLLQLFYNKLLLNMTTCSKLNTPFSTCKLVVKMRAARC